jgi:chemotaxis protein MotB
VRKFRCALVGLLLLGGCGVSQELYNARTTELDKAQAELSKAQNELGQSHARNDGLREQVEQRDEQIGKLQAEASKLAGNLSATEREMAALRKAHAQAEQRSELYRGLVARLRDAISAGTIAVEVRKGKMLVKLADQILFDPGQTALKTDGQKALREVAQALKEIPDRDFLVAGHTDNQPIKSSGFGSNWDLSTARAVTVVRFLQSEGVDPRHLAAAGYSEFDSVGDNASSNGRAQNRRIEVVVMPRIDELPSIDVTPPADAAPAPAAPATGSPSTPAPPTS